MANDVSVCPLKGLVRSISFASKEASFSRATELEGETRRHRLLDSEMSLFVHNDGLYITIDLLSLACASIVGEAARAVA